MVPRLTCKFHTFEQCVSHTVVSDSAIPWTVALQAPLFMDFSRQEHWSGLPVPSPGDFPNPGIEPGSPSLQADSLPSEPQEKPFCIVIKIIYYESFSKLIHFPSLGRHCLLGGGPALQIWNSALSPAEWPWVNA